ncbi:hypothetical protein [Muricomes intestini]|jgi:hypothetical protein|uniref:hypothetical protein n=1 Tax=Muricomes intestini TaxID=1796634 RepID=UPI002FE154AB
MTAPRGFTKNKVMTAAKTIILDKKIRVLTEISGCLSKKEPEKHWIKTHNMAELAKKTPISVFENPLLCRKSAENPIIMAYEI